MIRTYYLTKYYKDLVALDRLNLEVGEGDVYGFIGPNGAGKTTTLKILATLLRPTYGRAEICGYSVHGRAKTVRRLIGYMPDFFGVYDDMTVAEYLGFFAAAYRIRGKKRKRIIDDVLALTDLHNKRNALVESLSRGVQQRLGIARVLIHDPKVLLLDEPASGLDPRARIEIRELLLELQRMGKTILISSHILSELSELCSKIGVIEKGKLLFSGTLSEAMARVGKRRIVTIELVNEAERAAKMLLEHPAVQSASHNDGVISVELLQEFQDISAIAEFLMKKDFRLRLFKEEELNLEDAFMRMTDGAVS